MIVAFEGLIKTNMKIRRWMVMRGDGGLIIGKEDQTTIVIVLPGFFPDDPIAVLIGLRIDDQHA